MKKIILIALAIVLTFSLCACGNKKDGTGSEDKGILDAAEELFEVEVTLPAIFFSDSTPDEIIASAQARGFLDCTVNEDGSVTYKMTKSQNKEMLKEFEQTIQVSIDQVLNDKLNYKSVQEIKHSDDMSQFDVIVDKNSFGMIDSLCAILFYMDGAMYQMFAGKAADDIDVIVNFVDATSGEIINTASYKNWIAGQ